MKLRDVLCVSLLLAVSMLAAAGEEAGKASGQLTVNGKTTQLNYAYAQISKNSPEDEQEFIHVLLSDVPVPPLRRGSSALKKMAKEGKLHALEVSVTQDKDTLGATIYDPAIADGYVPVGFKEKFEPQVVDGNAVAGRVFTEEEGSFFEDRFEFDITFRAAVAPYPLSLSEADKAAIAGQQPGTAAGEFIVKDQATQLTHAYVVGRRDFPGDPEKLSVVLSDGPIPEDVLLGSFGMQELAREGKVHAVEVEIGADREPKGGQIYHRGFAKEEGESASVSVSGMHIFLPETFDANTVAGKLFMKEMDDFMGTEYHYGATFRATVLRKPPPTYEGTKAALSGPGKTVTAFMSAARLGNKLALKKLVAPEMAAQLDGPDGAMMMKMIKATFPVGLKVVEVTEKGDRAEVIAMKATKSGKETIKLHTVKMGGEWRVGQEEGAEPPKPRDPPTPEQIAAAQTGPGKLLLEFADAIHEKNVAKLKALSANPESFKDMEGPFGEMALDILSKMFPWDLRITRVTQTGDTAVVEAESATVKEPLKVDTVLLNGVWKIADKPK
ncbi:MAG TPA: hypothetical protein VNK82_12610 [Terriglobales bacterium]|nr:hypothetical protein [Terriglobales bacterium]